MHANCKNYVLFYLSMKNLLQKQLKLFIEPALKVRTTFSGELLLRMKNRYVKIASKQKVKDFIINWRTQHRNSYLNNRPGLKYVIQTKRKLVQGI